MSATTSLNLDLLYIGVARGGPAEPNPLPNRARAKNMKEV